MLHLRTERLDLVAATPELLQAERMGPVHLEKKLAAHVPPSWPPPLNGDDTLRWSIAQLAQDPGAVGWVCWYFLHREHGQRRAVGVGGFAGRPGADGVVEIGYSIVPECHRLGLAPEAVHALLAWAFGHREVQQVRAHTRPELVPSIRVLEKCGFRRAGAGTEPGTVRFELQRPE